jgi:hypothetical protein
MLGIGFYIADLEKKKIESIKQEFWLVLHRKSDIEFLYKGVPGNVEESKLVRAFHVKTGMREERPTPLPQLFGRKYWVVTKKFETSDNFETAPYFIELNVPAPAEPPYGPVPYLECEGLADAEAVAGKQQCNWQIPGPFGLHGVNGDLTRLDSDNIGSSGCIRHTDSDITYLYKKLDPKKSEIRYYIKDI